MLVDSKERYRRTEPIRLISRYASRQNLFTCSFRPTQTFTSELQDSMVRATVNASEEEGD